MAKPCLYSSLEISTTTSSWQIFEQRRRGWEKASVVLQVSLLKSVFESVTRSHTKGVDARRGRGTCRNILQYLGTSHTFLQMCLKHFWFSFNKSQKQPKETNTWGCQIATVTMETSTLSQRKGRAPQPSITWRGIASQGGSSMTMTWTQLHKAARFVTCNFGGGGVLHDNDDADVTP